LLGFPFTIIVAKLAVAIASIRVISLIFLPEQQFSYTFTPQFNIHQAIIRFNTARFPVRIK
jgi:hypothetical protein